MTDALLPLDEVARRLDRRPHEVVDLIHAGVLESRRRDRQVLVTRSSLEQAIEDGTSLLGFAQLRRDLDTTLFEADVGPDPIDALESEGYRLRGPGDALVLASTVSRQPAGAQMVVGLDRVGRVQVFTASLEEVPVAESVATLAFFGLPGESMFVVSNRTGEAPADRPDDELEWESARGAAHEYGVRLLDWWITWGTAVFSAAEFAPSGPGWPAGSLGDVGLARIHPRRSRLHSRGGSR